MTNGTKKALNNKDLNSLDKFWELNKNSKSQTQDNKVRTNEQMIVLAQQIISQQLILEDYKYYNFILSFAKGEIVKNSYGKKLYVKLNSTNWEPSKIIGEIFETTTIKE